MNQLNSNIDVNSYEIKECLYCRVLKLIDEFMRVYDTKKDPFASYNYCSEQRNKTQQVKVQLIKI
ncbi:29631_t:CDS:2 [Racocetra persica]|uniref:29631_t:CDS:1 n=1 Tax=Racocetra persica TaxID=160502 RepID=A0ACA9KSE2_9GLOM|nr:29631_t:CDS:2 [Racocetra persica]